MWISIRGVRMLEPNHQDACSAKGYNVSISFPQIRSRRSERACSYHCFDYALGLLAQWTTSSNYRCMADLDVAWWWLQCFRRAVNRVNWPNQIRWWSGSLLAGGASCGSNHIWNASNFERLQAQHVLICLVLVSCPGDATDARRDVTAECWYWLILGGERLMAIVSQDQPMVFPVNINQFS